MTRPKLSPERDWQPYMREAILEAQLAAVSGDVPIGCVLVDADGKVLARGHNGREARKDPTAHAEIALLRAAAEQLGDWRLTGSTLVCTLEPCVMCAGALMLARVDRVVYGARDAKFGAMGSLYHIDQDERLNHRILRVGGVMEAECAEILKEFFRSRRA